MVVRLPPHRHCPNCNEPIPEDQQYCSERCETEVVGRKKREERRNLYFYIIAIVAIVALWLVTFIL